MWLSGQIACPPALGRDTVVSEALPSLGVLCMALGPEDYLGMQRPVVSQGHRADSFLFPPTRLTTQSVMHSLVTRGDPVRDCRWFYEEIHKLKPVSESLGGLLKQSF